MRRSLSQPLLIALLLAGCTQPGLGEPLLPADVSNAWIERFCAADDEQPGLLISNADSARWVAREAPRFDCPSTRFVEAWWFRWWSFRKHVVRTPSGRAITEFLRPVTHAGPYNTISCAVGHHIAEGRWLRDKALLDEDITFWLRGGPGGGPQAHLHNFSGWIAAAIDQRRRVTGDDGFAIGLLEDLVADYEQWKAERGLPDGLFWQYDVRDGMEESISGGRHERNARPTINSYMAGNAHAIARIARDAGRGDLADRFQAEGDDLCQRIRSSLWDRDALFFKTREETGRLSDAREQIGFIPWCFDLALPEHAAAWRQATDPSGFWAPAGLTTAERRHPAFRSHGAGTCEWDGAVWPFATSQTLTGLANLLHGSPQPYIDRRAYFDQLLRYAESHQKDGVAYLGEYHDEVDGKWLITGPKELRSRCYNHSTFCDLVITGLMGVLPQSDETVVVDPLLPEDGWDWCCVDGLPYHSHSLTVAWDRAGERYGLGPGLHLLIDGVQVANAPDLRRISAHLPTRQDSP